MAENKYLNQPVELRELIDTIVDSPSNNKSVSLTLYTRKHNFSSVSCSKPRGAPEVCQLRKGMHVAIRGVVTSEAAGVELLRYKFWSIPEDQWIGENKNEPDQRSYSQQKNSKQSR